MSIFESIKALFGLSSQEGIEDAVSSTSAYVDWLPNYMLGVSISRTVIDSHLPLPGAKRFPGDVPAASAVVNRLKILSGLSPVNYDQPQSGEFTQISGNYRIVLKTTFTDKEGRSCCSVVISVRGKQDSGNARTALPVHRPVRSVCES